MDYAGMRARAAALIERFGTGVVATITRTALAFDRTLNKQVASAPQVQTIKCAIGSLSAADRRLKSMLDMTVEETAKLYVPAAGLIFTPDVGDTVMLPGDAMGYAVRDRGRSRPDGTDIYHVLFLGRTGA